MKLKLHLSLILAFAVSIQFALATDHVIVFGVGGNVYNPNTLAVSVGDVIIFQGNFSAHPLASTEIPNGAQTFSQSSGTADFSYTATVAGDYAYRCTVHGGMTGTFTAESPEGIQVTPVTQGTAMVFPSVTSDIVNIDLSSVSNPERGIQLDLYNLAGQQLISERKTAGGLVQVSMGSVANGIYFLAIKQDGKVLLTRRVVKN